MESSPKELREEAKRLSLQARSLQIQAAEMLDRARDLEAIEREVGLKSHTNPKVQLLRRLRHADVHRMRWNGAVYKAIGQEYGISGDRARDMAREHERWLWGKLGKLFLKDEHGEGAPEISSDAPPENDEVRHMFEGATSGLWMGTRFSDLELTVRTANVLQNHNIVKVRDLQKFTAAQALREWKNFGRRCLKEILGILEKNNLTVPGWTDWPTR